MRNEFSTFPGFQNMVFTCNIFFTVYFSYLPPDIKKIIKRLQFSRRYTSMWIPFIWWSNSCITLTAVVLVKNINHIIIKQLYNVKMSVTHKETKKCIKICVIT